MEQVLDKQSLKALGADSRQQIIKLLSERPYTASELAKKAGKHVTTIAEHIRMLESSGLVEKKEDGHKWIYYRLTPKGERLTKPMFNSWKIMLALAALSFAGGIYDFLSYNGYAKTEVAQKAADDMAQYSQPEIWPFLVILAVVLLMAALVMKKTKK